jgi:hypothetical protein
LRFTGGIDGCLHGFIWRGGVVPIIDRAVAPVGVHAPRLRPHLHRGGGAIVVQLDGVFSIADAEMYSRVRLRSLNISILLPLRLQLYAAVPLFPAGARALVRDTDPRKLAVRGPFPLPHPYVRELNRPTVPGGGFDGLSGFLNRPSEVLLGRFGFAKTPAFLRLGTVGRFRTRG